MSKSNNSATRAIIEQANTWLVEMQDSAPKPEQTKGFQEWLRLSPVHVREYIRAEANWAALSNLDSDRKIDVDAILSSQKSSVIDFRGRPDPANTEAIEKPRRRRVYVLAAIAASFVVAIGVVGYFQASDEQSYRTTTGEQRRVVLDDGSVIELNTNSAVKVAMTDSSRQIQLIDGEALFSVAKDPDRPFIVESNGAVVRAIGTQFNVYRRSEKVLVTVLEGRVSVSGTDDPVGVVDQLTPVELGQGDRAEIAPNMPIIKSAANENDAVAWRELRLIFRDQPLSQVVDEFNRYNKTKLVIEDSALADKRISAVFDANKPETLVKFIAATTVVDVDFSDATQVIIRAEEQRR